MSESVDLLSAFPSLRDKYAVRLVSRLETSRESVREQKRREGFLNEIWDIVTGKGARRQHQVNAHLNDMLANQLEWLTDMSREMALGHRAIGDIQVAVRDCQHDLSILGGRLLALESALDSLAVEVGNRLDNLETQLSEVDLRQRAQVQLDRVMRHWEEGAGQWLSPGAALMSVLDQLWWGDFGLYLQRFPGEQAQLLLADLRQQAMVRLARMTGSGVHERRVRSEWFPFAGCSDDERLPQVVQFLTDWVHPERTPYTYALQCQADLETPIAAVPQLLSAERLSHAMSGEFFAYRELP